MMELTLHLPEWLESEIEGVSPLASAAERMRFVIGLSKRNVEERSGGPFAAAVFEEGSGRLVAAGVNCVEPLACSPAHAEIVALMFAQKRAGSFDLGALGRCQLVSSSQPCVMCFGAILWSGVKGLAFSASRLDVERSLGFDEGPLPPDWEAELEKRGIAVQGGLLRDEAVAVLALYKKLGLPVYSPRR